MTQIISPDEFLERLKKSQLLTPEQLQAVTRKARSQFSTGSEQGTAEQLAGVLVRKKFLTTWQQDQLFRGQTGFILQQYRLLRPVAKGGMGLVFEARDDRNGRRVAIKLLAARLTGDQSLVERFRREIRATLRLNSPHVVRTLDAGRVGKTDFMVMEYVQGEQLDQIARRLRVLPVAVACEIIRQAAVGLQHAHERQMVHRDIKPANLIIAWGPDPQGQGTVKLMDLGLVRMQAEDEDMKSNTRAGQVMGTPDYMSPEQGWDTATVDIRGDIYSLGCTLFRLLTGRVPFVGDNPLQVLMARCHRDAPSVRSVRQEIPAGVDAVVSQMTLRDPAGRYQTPQEVVDALVPFCLQLTQQELQKSAAAESANNSDDVEGSGGGNGGSSDSLVQVSDAGYQQFLREMSSGAEVDLIDTTTPIRRTRSRRGSKLNLAISAIACVVLLSAVWFVWSPGGSQPLSKQSDTLPDGSEPLAENSPASIPLSLPPSADLSDELTDSGSSIAAADDMSVPRDAETNPEMVPLPSGTLPYPERMVAAVVSFHWPVVTAQTVTAGELLSLPVIPRVAQEYLNSVRIEAAGVSDQAGYQALSGRLVWEVPQTALGTYRIQLTAALIPQHLRFSDDSITTTTIVIDVLPAIQPDRTPPEDQVALAEQELRTILRRELVQARTAHGRMELAQRLLGRSLDQLADAADYALLKIVEELAGRARAADLLFEVAAVRAERYGSDELEAGLKTAADIRRQGLTPLQIDVVVEHSVRLAAAAAARQRWADVASLLAPVDQILRGQAGVSRQMSDDLGRARAGALDLVELRQQTADLTGISQIKIQEVIRLLRQWQFVELFAQPNSLIHLQSSTMEMPLADLGRSLWVRNAGRLTFQTSSQNGLAGFIDPGVETGRCVIRFRLLPETNAASLILGAGRETELQAWLLSVDATAPGRIQRLPGGATVSESLYPGHSMPPGMFPAEYGTQVEIVIDGTQVTARLNGIQVCLAELPDLQPGRLGLMVPLLRPGSGPRLALRYSRILLLPENTR